MEAEHTTMLTSLQSQGAHSNYIGIDIKNYIEMDTLYREMKSRNRWIIFKFPEFQSLPMFKM